MRNSVMHALTSTASLRSLYVLLILCALAELSSSAAINDDQAKAPSVQSLAWLSGTWAARHGDEELVEVWGEPSGNSMAGMFRWNRQGKAWMYELMTITQEANAIVFRLRHFDAQLTPWEKDGPLTYPLLRAGGKDGKHEVVFENLQRDTQRFIYRRPGGGDTLIIRLEAASEGKANEFRLTRTPSL